MLKWKFSNINLFSLFQVWFTSTRGLAPMENPRRVQVLQTARTPMCLRGRKIFQFQLAQTTPLWWSWDRNPTSGKSPTRKKLTRGSLCRQIWRSQKTLFLDKLSRLPWRDLCQGGYWYLLDISLSELRLFFLSRIFLFLKSDFQEKMLFFQFNFRKRNINH